MTYSVSSVIGESGALCPTIDFAPADVISEVLQNISTLLGTVRGTVPLDRDFGISDTNVGRPFPAAQALIAASVYSAIAEYEPRAEVRDVQVEYSVGGRVEVKVEFSIL
jgi:hypothetical protein